MRRTSVLTVAVLAMAAVLALAGCGGDSEETTAQESAEETLCLSLKDFSAAMLGYYALNPVENSKSDYEDALSEAQSALDQVVASAQDVSEADTAALESAYSELGTSIESLDEDVPLAEAAQQEQVGQDAIAVNQAWREMFNGLNCVQYAVGS